MYFPKLYGIYDRDLTLCFVGDVQECCEYTGLEKKQFLCTVHRHKGNQKINNKGYHMESIGDLEDFKIER